MRKIGYVRVSSQEQNEERQIKQLNEITNISRSSLYRKLDKEKQN